MLDSLRKGCPVQSRYIYLLAGWAVHIFVGYPGRRGLAVLPVQLFFRGQTNAGFCCCLLVCVSVALGILIFLLVSNCSISSRFFENWQWDICTEQQEGYIQQYSVFFLRNQAKKKLKLKYRETCYRYFCSGNCDLKKLQCILCILPLFPFRHVALFHHIINSVLIRLVSNECVRQSEG